MHKQIKEVVQAECAVCNRTKDVNFYSLSVCNACHECPECGCPANECLQTYPYFCLAANERRVRIKCAKCGAAWASRLKLDRAVIHKAYSGPAPICKVCGKDVHHSHKSVWSILQNVPCICSDCLDCPTCRTGGHFDPLHDDGSVKCSICGEAWGTIRDLENSVCQRLETFPNTY